MGLILKDMGPNVNMYSFLIKMDERLLYKELTNLKGGYKNGR